MNHKTLVNRFAKACYRFEAIQEDLDILLFDTDDEIKANEYEDLADQAAEIVLKLSANGNNVGMHFYNYYLCRLEYIIAYFRELLDYEENAATDEAGAVEEDDSEDEQSAKLDDENDTQTAESDEAAAAPAAGVPLPLEEKPCFLLRFLGLNRLSSEDRDRVRDTFVMWYEMNEVTGRNRGDRQTLPAAEILKSKDNAFSEFEYDMEFGKEHLILADEREIRAAIENTIDEIPGFRDSEEFKKLIEQCPTYKEIEEL